MTRQEAAELKREVYFSGQAVEPVGITGRGNRAVLHCIELGNGYGFELRSAAEWAEIVAGKSATLQVPARVV